MNSPMKEQRKGPPKVSGLLNAGKLHLAQTDEEIEAVRRLPTFVTEAQLRTPALAPSSLLLPLAKLRPSPYNSRKHRSAERITELAESLRTNLQREPITVYHGTGQDEGFFMVLSGETRRLSAAMLGWSTLEATIDYSVDPSNPLSIVQKSHAHNDTEKETALDHFTLIKMLSASGLSKTDITNALGLVRRDLYRFEAFDKLPQSVLDIAQQHPTRFTSHVADICKSALDSLGNELLTDLVREYLQSDKPRSYLESRIKSEQRKDNRPQRRTRISTIEFKMNGHKVGALTVMKSTVLGSKTLRFDSTLSDDLADRLTDELESVLKTFAHGGTNGS